MSILDASRSQSFVGLTKIQGPPMLGLRPRERVRRTTAGERPPRGDPMASEQKMSRMQLTAMVVGGMVGAGIFSLPRTFAGATGPLGAVIAWIIAGTGMYMLARVFQALAERKPDLDAGVFA